jgi:pyrroloquinoline quinone biosynthesis protein B
VELQLPQLPRRARRQRRARRRTQSSIAVSADGARWTWSMPRRTSCSRSRLSGTWPPAAARLRHRIGGAGGRQIDHTTGLYMLREKGSPWPIWCTDPVHEDLTPATPSCTCSNTTAA